MSFELTKLLDSGLPDTDLVGDQPVPAHVEPGDADALVAVRCGSVTLTEGRMGRVGDRVAIRVTKPLRKPRTTLAMFEKADEQTKMMEAQ